MTKFFDPLSGEPRELNYHGIKCRREPEPVGMDFGDGKDGTGFERREGRHQRRELGGRERPGGSSAHPQPFFWRSWSMRRFCKSVARG